MDKPLQTKVSVHDVKNAIVSEHFFTALQGARMAALDYVHDPAQPAPNPLDPRLESMTVCVLTLKNGQKVVGINYGAIDPRTHSPEMGRVEARAEAENKVWEFLGYDLRTKLTA